MAVFSSAVSVLCIIVLMIGADKAAHVPELTGGQDIDFIATRFTPDGEFETRVSYSGIQAIETVVPELGEHGLFYRVVTNGKLVVTSIYQNEDLLVDCDVARDEGDIANFYDRFLGSKFQDQATSAAVNATMSSVDGDIDDKYKPLLNFNQLKTDCRGLHRYLKQQYKLKRRQENGLFEQDGQSDATDDLFDDDSESEDANDAANDLALGSDHHRSERHKRAMLIYPGTNWCGTGNTAQHYNDLGENMATDKCCRAHDHCPYVINGFSSKFNFFNYRFHTLSHCQCDITFKSCLRRAGNSVANMVGSLFFNVVGTKCFVLKPERVCNEWSWWGKCTAYSKQYSASVMEPEGF